MRRWGVGLLPAIDPPEDDTHPAMSLRLMPSCRGRTFEAQVLVLLCACPTRGEGETAGATEATESTTGSTEAGPATDSTEGTGTVTSASVGETTEASETTGTTTAEDEDIVAACGLPEPCPRIVAQCAPEHQDCEGPFLAGMLCALSTLAAGSPAYLDYFFNGYLTGEEDWLDIAILGDGTAIRQYGSEAPYTEYGPPERCTLRPSEWFEACLAEPTDVEQRIECNYAYAWFEDDCTPTPTCP